LLPALWLLRFRCRPLADAHPAPTLV